MPYNTAPCQGAKKISTTVQKAQGIGGILTYLAICVDAASQSALP